MKKKILLDSYALLAYLKKEDNHLPVKEALSSEDTLCMMNELNIGETYYILSRQRGHEQADYFLEVILPSLPIKAIPNDFRQTIEASRLKAKYPMSFVDCFAAATALAERAVILTGDPEFKNVEGLIAIKWL
ncbi:MAG: type II toxin-antitoxin system VapC family toxin [Thermodesulfovibrionales bacterium]|nr:type II toxin-antitoxin system VapC family toxin [Thermodesulfovibrionales bacterium]